TWRKQRRQS
ncbi:unnamed protein product, partial [Allacma fusca]